MKKEIEIENKQQVVKLPEGFTAETRTDAFGNTIYFGGYHAYVPYTASRLFVEEMIKELMLLSGLKPKKIIGRLTHPK